MLSVYVVTKKKSDHMAISQHSHIDSVLNILYIKKISVVNL